MWKAKPHSLTRAGFLFIWWLIALTAIWALVLEPTYDVIIVRVSAAILHTFESPPMTGSIRLEGPYAIVSHQGPAAAIPAQRLELRTHQNNAPLLFALIFATPWLSWRRRLRVALVAGCLLWLTHIFHFLVTVHWLYSWENTGPYRVTDLSYLHKGFWQSLDNSAQIRKYIINYTYQFYTRVGRLIAPILLWMIFGVRGHKSVGRD